MAYQKIIVCLAKSKKHDGYCIVGKELIGGRAGGWIRVVSDHKYEEITNSECKYDDGKEADLLDIITIPLLEARPHDHQAENHLIDASKHWKKDGNFDGGDIESLVDSTGAPLWTNGHSSYYGLNDRVHAGDLKAINHSLLLIKPSKLTICVEKEGAEFGNPKRKIRAEFKYGKEEYKLTVTDPAIWREYWPKLGQHQLGNDVVLCVSLGEIHEGYAYKIVATVIMPDVTKTK